jgi:hypothetical protein
LMMMLLIHKEDSKIIIWKIWLLFW